MSLLRATNWTLMSSSKRENVQSNNWDDSCWRRINELLCLERLHRETRLVRNQKHKVLVAAVGE